MPKCADSVKGTFRTTKSGSIEYRFHYYDDNNVNRVKSITAPTKDECLNRAEDFIKKNSFSPLRAVSNITLVEIIEKRINDDYRKNITGVQGYDRNLSTLRIIAKSAIGNMAIADITDVQLECFLEDVKHYSTKVLNKIYRFIASAYEKAYKEGLIEVDPIKYNNICCPKSSRSAKKVRGMTEEEQSEFVKVLMDHKVPYGRNTYKTQLLLELYTGMRMGEINALKPENVNIREGYVKVTATISRGMQSKNFYKPHPKTDNSIREVPLTKEAKDLLRDAIKDMKKNPEGLIFYDFNKGDVVATYQVGTFFKRICEKGNIPYYGQHALRHTFATRCIEAGVPPLVLKKWLGHTNIGITINTYADVFDRMNHSAVTKYEMLMDEIMQ